jgi:hypothetical protein
MKAPKDSGAPESFGKGLATGAKYVPLPEKYLSAESTDIEVEVKSGKNTHNIELRGPALKK